MSYTAYRRFARDLVRTGELDPLYTMLYRARKTHGDEWVMRFALYMLMFYDPKRAAWIADKEPARYWEYVRDNFNTHTRGKERRHFRGANGIDGYTSLQALGSATQAFQVPFQATTYPEFVQALESAGVKSFGPYFQLKWCDYATCVFDCDISMSRLPLMLPDPPKKCIKKILPHLSTLDAMYAIKSWIEDLDDPFSGKRKCGFSEAETVACGIDTYLLKGTYKMGDDIRKYHDALAGRSDLLPLLPWRV